MITETTSKSATGIKKKSNTTLIMEPPGISKETLIKAKTMRAELLIQTNEAQIVRHVKICRNINLSIHTSLSNP